MSFCGKSLENKKGVRMKLLLSALLIVSFSAKTEVISKEYTGNNRGKACTLNISTGSEYGDHISLDDCSSTLPSNVKLIAKDGRIFVPRGYAQISESKDCTIELTLNQNNEPTKAKMKAGGFFSPILLNKLTCENLILVK